MHTLHEDYLPKILAARVYEVSQETRLHKAPKLSERLGNQVLIKREDEQPIFSFKCRGAFNRIFRLTQEGSVSGVIAASAGNHAQGVALTAQTLGLPAIIVMPTPTPSIKVDAVRAMGADIVLHGDNFDSALAHANQLVDATGYSFIHPFDHPDTIAGQATIGVEINRQHPDKIDAVFVPVGGGGIASGVALYLKYLRPDIKVFGVEPVDAACMKKALDADERVVLDSVSLFADGVAVKQAGEETFRICRELLDGVILITVDEMSTAIKDIFNDTRTLAEPAGALGVAGLKKYVQTTGVKDQTLVAINTGANINFDRLRHIAERVEIGDSREALFGVRIPETPGSFLNFCHVLGRRSITEFNYRYSDAKSAVVFAGVEVERGAEERAEIAQRLEQAGFEVLDMTHNDTAKLHIRHMIGGHAKLPDEQVHRLRFPERPGALLDFLKGVGEQWNISMFHYRNHGAAYARVLIGIQVPDAHTVEFPEFISGLGFPAQNESDNEAFEWFLR